MPVATVDVGPAVVDVSEVLHALQLMTDHIVPTWDVTKPPNQSEIRATKVVAVSLQEMSGKVRSGAAVNVEEDESAQYWSGYVPVMTRLGEPVTNEDSWNAIPESVRNLVGQSLHEISRLGR